MKRLHLLSLLLLLSPGAFAQITFTANGVWTVPAGVTMATFEVIGAGGNGGMNGGSGGGGGGYSKGTFAVVPNATHNIVVGTAGSSTPTSVSGLGISATPGGNGSSGPSAVGGAGGVGTGGTINRAGGNGGNGTWTYFGGGGGGAAGPLANGGLGGNTPPWNNNCLQPGGSPGIGGGAPAGAGGKGAGFTDNNCTVTNPAGSGSNYGGGGGGGNGINSPAGAGAGGFVTISWCNTAAPTGAATQNFCAPPTVANLAATGTDIKWYAAATGGSPLPSTTVLVNNTIYYASQTVASCESPTRLPVTAMVTTVNVTVTKSAATLTAAATGVTYQWFDCDSNKIVTGATSQSYTATKNGNYSVIITQGNCKDTSGCEPVTAVGLPGKPGAAHIRVYPNPAREMLIVAVQPSLVGTAYTITDAVGRTVLSGVLTTTTNEIPLRGLAAGSYHLHAGSGTDMKFRVIKE